jgi:hypothetical protein
MPPYRAQTTSDPVGPLVSHDPEIKTGAERLELPQTAVAIVTILSERLNSGVRIDRVATWQTPGFIPIGWLANDGDCGLW